MTRHCDFPVFDADNHLYETEDAFTRHLPRRYQRAIEYVQVRGRTKIAIRGTISDYIPNPTFEVVARPGAQEEYFRIGNPEGKSYRELVGEPMKCIPAFREPGPRLALMDELGVDRTLMFPTLASLLEERMRDDPALIHAAIHSLNEWLYETWSFNYEDRIFTTPIITLPIVEKAIEELAWCVERGAKTVLIRPAPVPCYGGSRSFGYPEFDPFWQAVVDADILVSMHSSDSGYSRYQSDWTGPMEMLPFQPDPFRWLTMGKRPIEDSMAAFVCHGAFTRLPDLRVAVIESGGDWVVTFLEHLEDVYRKMPNQFDEDPVEGVQAQRLHQPLPRGQARRADRCDRGRARAVRLGLPASRGSRGAVQLRRPPAARPAREERGRDHGRQPGAAHARAGLRAVVAIESLLRSLTLEPTGPDTYRAETTDGGYGVVFGGQLLGQSIVAGLTGQDGKAVKTVHTIFARSASPEAPVAITRRSHARGPRVREQHRDDQPRRPPLHALTRAPERRRARLHPSRRSAAAGAGPRRLRACGPTLRAAGRFGSSVTSTSATPGSSVRRSSTCGPASSARPTTPRRARPCSPSRPTASSSAPR